MSFRTSTLALFFATCASVASAQAVFDVKLGGKTLGTLSYNGSDEDAAMVTTLNNTPLRVFNGTMRATSKTAGGRQVFNAETGAEEKDRTVVITHKSGRALETMVDPARQMTALSDPAKVPAGIIDPVQAIGQMINAPSCPKRITIYDGRRAVSLSVVEASVKDGVETCKMAYRVVAGPPHLSPLNVSKAKMRLMYSADDTPRRLNRIDVSHGPFRVKLVRR